MAQKNEKMRNSSPRAAFIRSAVQTLSMTLQTLAAGKTFLLALVIVTAASLSGRLYKDHLDAQGSPPLLSAVQLVCK